MEKEQMKIFNTAAEQKAATGNGARLFNVNDAVKIGSWQEVDGIDAATITKNTEDTSKLSGLIIRGYETKFGKTNENQEQYDKDCLDDFFDRYYIKNKLNIPVTIQHGQHRVDIVGRVLLVEVNTVGFYFVVYIPKGIEGYEDIKVKIKEGILQGLSKEGYSEDWECHYDQKTGDFQYVTIKKMDVLAMSIVTTPANGVAFEKIQEIKNTLTYIKQTPNKASAAADPFEGMFNHK